MEPLINTMNSQMPICEMKPLISVETRRITVLEIAQRLDVGRLAVYAMLEQKVIPGIRLGRRWIITRHAYEQWERTCGVPAGAGLVAQPEATVLN
jgi:excisionase family DNA binding protein